MPQTYFNTFLIENELLLESFLNKIILFYFTFLLDQW